MSTTSHMNTPIQVVKALLMYVSPNMLYVLEWTRTHTKKLLQELVTYQEAKLNKEKTLE